MCNGLIHSMNTVKLWRIEKFWNDRKRFNKSKLSKNVKKMASSTISSKARLGSRRIREKRREGRTLFLLFFFLSQKKVFLELFCDKKFVQVGRIEFFGCHFFFEKQNWVLCSWVEKVSFAASSQAVEHFRWIWTPLREDYWDKQWLCGTSFVVVLVAENFRKKRKPKKIGPLRGVCLT